MKLDFSITKLQRYLKKSLRPLLLRHYFISTLGLLFILIAAVFLVNQTLQAPSDEAYRSEKSSGGINAQFDQATIKKIENLQRSTDQPSSEPTSAPGTRTNPFAE